MNAREKFVYQYYLDKGVSPAAAAAITGNLSVESGGFASDVIAGQRRGDQGSAHYVQQLRGDRLTKFRQFSKAKGRQETALETQLDFVLEEMDPASPYKDNIAAANRDKILNSNDPVQATQAFAKYYERPNPKHAHMDRRTAIAQAAPTKPVTRAELVDAPVEVASLEPEPQGLAALLSGRSRDTQYANQGAKRNQRLSPATEARMEQAAAAAGKKHGVEITPVVASGGQFSERELNSNVFEGRRTGSTRHDHGQAGDFEFKVNGRLLNMANRQDRDIMSSIIEENVALGATGVGGAPDYMGLNRLHIGGGDRATWGKKGSPASKFVRDAYARGASRYDPNEPLLVDVPVPAERDAPLEIPDTGVSEPEVMLARGPTPPDFFLDKPVHKTVEGPDNPKALLETGPSAVPPGVLVEPERLLEPVETAAVAPDVSNSMLDTIPRGSPLEVPEIQTAKVLDAAPSQPSILPTPTQPEAPQTFAQMFNNPAAPAAPSQPAIAQAPTPPIAVPNLPATPASMQTAMSQPTGGFDLGGILGGIASALGAAASRPQPGNIAEQKPVEGLLPTPELRHVEPSTPSQLAQNNMPTLSDIDLFDEEDRRKRFDAGPQLSSLFRPSRAFG